MLTQKTIANLLADSQKHQCQPDKFGGVCVKMQAVAKLPTRFGNFQIVAFQNNKDNKDHVAIIKGNVVNKTEVLVRLHSECLTGDAFGSLRCDCRDQLTASLEFLGGQQMGVLLYLRQEGRGIGLVNKIKAYALQDLGYDTIEADQKLGFSGDEREYDIAAHMLHSLKIKSIKLLTNNPKKIEGLAKHGIRVSSRVPLLAPINRHNRFYLETKKEKAGHLLDLKVLDLQK